jgi:hypothetical protein
VRDEGVVDMGDDGDWWKKRRIQVNSEVWPYK